jgi:hypothetical protein
MNTHIQPAESLGYYPSEYITGRESNIPRSTAEVCLKPEFIGQFWREAVKAIDKKSDSDQDGVIYSSDEIGVFLGPWDIDIRHNCKRTEKRGGDSYMGIWESYSELEESFEVVGAHDYDNDVELHGVVHLLNRYYKDHENILLNR